ncbi:hypothetical protein R3I93_019287 [Phoxinus phoxinus]|uniref:Uncharacterized protein n=1 Tax=Phoxinus phoxinus TaxID=58324 RepID=A0AAN9GTZ7_9TELE
MQPALISSPFNCLVLEYSNANVILGDSWLIHHSPVISWSTRDVLKWGSQCFPGCFPTQTLPTSSVPIKKPFSGC